MDWLFDNLQLLLVIGGAVAYWLNQRRKGEEDEAGPTSPSAEQHGEANAEDEVRRIQEEIRRKIAQRTGGASRESAQQHTPTRQPHEMPRSFSQEVQPPPPPLPQRRVNVYDDTEEISRQQRLAADLKRLEDRRRETRELVERVRREDVTARAFPSAAASSEPVLAHEFLRDPQALKRAVIMREVLGPPVSMR